LLAQIRGEDGCARLDDGRLLLMLPSTGPSQAAALVERLGGLVLTEAQWGESAAALLLRA
jgi:GGDEF domain-containing protein